MKRNIEWKEKLEDGSKRLIRVTFIGGGKIKWQFKNVISRGNEGDWDYDTPASAEDWDELEDKIQKAVNRRSRPLDDLTAIKKTRKHLGL